MAEGGGSGEGHSRAAEALAPFVKEDLWDHETEGGAADAERRSENSFILSD